MAKNNNLTDFVTDLANNIRDKVGLPTTAKINPQNFGDVIGKTPNLTLVYVQTDKITTDGGDFTVDLNGVPDVINVLPYSGTGNNTENLMYVYVFVVELKATAINAELNYEVYPLGSNNIAFKHGTFAESATQTVYFAVVDNLCYPQGGGDDKIRGTLTPIGGWLGGFATGQTCTVTSKVYRLSVGTPELGRRNPLALRTCKGVPQP